MLLWLYTVFKFAASKHCPWARRTKRRFKRFISVTSQFLFIDQSSKNEKTTRILWNIDIEIVVAVTPLAVIVMDTFDCRPPKLSFSNRKKIARGRVTDNRYNANVLKWRSVTEIVTSGRMKFSASLTNSRAQLFWTSDHKQKSFGKILLFYGANVFVSKFVLTISARPYCARKFIGHILHPTCAK